MPDTAGNYKLLSRDKGIAEGFIQLKNPTRRALTVTRVQIVGPKDMRYVYARLTMWICRKLDIAPVLAHILIFLMMGVGVMLIDPFIRERILEFRYPLGEFAFVLGFCAVILLFNLAIFRRKYLLPPSKGGGLD